MCTCILPKMLFFLFHVLYCMKDVSVKDYIVVYFIFLFSVWKTDVCKVKLRDKHLQILYCSPGLVLVLSNVSNDLNRVLMVYFSFAAF